MAAVLSPKAKLIRRRVMHHWTRAVNKENPGVLIDTSHARQLLRESLDEVLAEEL